MKVLIFEPQYVGHNLAYVRQIASRLVEMQCEVHLLTSVQATQSEEFRKHLDSVLPSIQVLGLDRFSVRAGSQGIRVNGPHAIASMMQSFLSGLKRVEPEHVFIPFGNPLAHWCGFPNPLSSWLRRNQVETELVLLFGKYAYPHTDWKSAIKEKIALSILAKGPWTRIHHIVPHAIDVMKRHPSRLASIAHLLPDPVEAVPSMSKSEARRMLGLPTQSRIVSLVGLLERRKGVRELLEAFEIAKPNLLPTDKVLLAGKATDETRELLANRFAHLIADGSVLCIDRHLTSNELWAALIGCDLTTTPYPEHVYSASLVIRGAAAGIPVLSNSIGWMDQTVRRFQLGTVCNTNDKQVFAEHLRMALDGAAGYSTTIEAKRFVDFHSSENFAAKLTQRLAERMGIRDAAESSRNLDQLMLASPLPAAA
ncbi:MAG: glycosyltransferase [Pirellula sp.]|jgi:glycosyltransferase involved in cell wall biosynthesis